MRPEDIHQIVRTLKKEIRQWPLPAIGHYVETPFTTLISCILSLRTQDKTTNAASERLLAIAETPEKMLATPVDAVQKAIYPVSFYRVKAGIAVDTPVHRISNRLGYVRTKNPDDTEMALRKKLPRRYWIIYNDLLVV